MPSDRHYCKSTYSGAGYSVGDYWEGDTIVCNYCKTRIENPTQKTE